MDDRTELEVVKRLLIQDQTTWTEILYYIEKKRSGYSPVIITIQPNNNYYHVTCICNVIGSAHAHSSGNDEYLSFK